MSYDPTLGRFIEMDPAMYIDGPNRYQMERSNPVRLTDPFGLEGGDTDSDQIALKIFNHGIGVEEKAGNRLSALLMDHFVHGNGKKVTIAGGAYGFASANDTAAYLQERGLGTPFDVEVRFDMTISGTCGKPATSTAPGNTTRKKPDEYGDDYRLSKRSTFAVARDRLNAKRSR